ncbi:hypothetical protein [Streptomyces sp. NRRL S-337]|nr:hypothetical protein [Streptomyces sp. NRRL S-337]
MEIEEGAAAGAPLATVRPLSDRIEGRVPEASSKRFVAAEFTR